MKVTKEDRLNEMAKVGFFSEKQGDGQHKTGFKVFVTNDSRPLAHVHITHNTKQKFVCVEFNSAKYFIHSGYPDVFTNKEATEFNEFLKTHYQYAQTFLMGDVKFKVETYWQYAIYQWKLENDGVTDNLDLKVDNDGFVIFPEQPDYSKLNETNLGRDKL